MPTTVTCPRCGQENPEHARFCLECAAPLAEAVGPFREERKVVSVLFVDLVDFTATSDTADPEDVRARLRGYPGSGTTRDVCARASATAMLAEYRGQLVEAEAGYADAARRWTEFGGRLETAHALVGRGRCLLALGRPGADDALAYGRKLLLELGAQPLVAETDRLLGEATALTS